MSDAAKPASSRDASTGDARAVRRDLRRADAKRLERLVGSMLLPEDRPSSLAESFTLRPVGRVTRERPAHQAVAGVMRLLRSTKSPTKRSRRSSLPSPKPAESQRCAIRFSYTQNAVRGQFAAHGRYLIRDSAAEGSAPYGTDPDLVATLRRWQAEGDRRLYKVIVSPEFGDRCDLTALTQDLMKAVQRDLGHSFEWAAINHFNTDHPHVHIAIRSVDGEGRVFRFPREYVQHGFREQAERLCTLQIGHRTPEDIQLSRKREVQQFRWTSLDKTIQQLASRSPESTIADATGLIRDRLQFLTRAGIVEGHRDQWRIPAHLNWTLRQMALTADRQRMLHQARAAISDDRLPFSRVDLEPGQTLRGRVLAHTEDDRTGRTYLILEGTDGLVHFLPHNARISAFRRQGKLGPGHFIAFTPTPEGHQIGDHGDAEAYLSGPSFDSIPLPAERTSAGSQIWRGWLGRYHQRLIFAPGKAAKAPEPTLNPTRRPLQRNENER